MYKTTQGNSIFTWKHINECLLLIDWLLLLTDDYRTFYFYNPPPWWLITRVVIQKEKAKEYSYAIRPNPQQKVLNIEMPIKKVRRIEVYMLCMGNITGVLASIKCANDGKWCDEAPTGWFGWECGVNDTQLRSAYVIGYQDTKGFPLVDSIRRRAEYISAFPSGNLCPDFTTIVCSYDLRKNRL